MFSLTERNIVMIKLPSQEEDSGSTSRAAPNMLLIMTAWLAAAALIPGSISAPVNKTHDDTVGWVSDPNGRGTFGLIASCVTTLTLCVWSAICLNITPVGKSKSHRFWYWVRFVVLGILIPELVMLSAWRQWLSGRRLTNEIRHVLDEERKNQTDRKTSNASLDFTQTVPQEPWTIIHSMYAGMGGFAFEMKLLQETGKEAIPSHKRLHISPLGVVMLAKCGALPNISKQEILDKDKADTLAKCIVLGQAGWFVVQTIARAIEHQPVTLLEVNTMAHVFCAFIIYLLWWHKPKEVSEPTIVQGPTAAQLCAFFFMSSRVSGLQPTRKAALRAWIVPEMQKYRWDDGAVWPSTADKSQNGSAHPKQLTTSNESATGGLAYAIKDTKTSKAQNSRLRTRAPEAEAQGMLVEVPIAPMKRGTANFAKKCMKPDFLPTLGDNRTKAELRRQLASEALQAFPCLQDDQQLITDPSVTLLNPTDEKGRIVCRELVAESASDWPSDWYLPGLAGELIGCALWLTAMAYGAIHMAAWYDYFPSSAEKYMWRASATYITAASFLWLTFNVFAVVAKRASSYWDSYITFDRFWLEYAVTLPIAAVCGTAYMFARSYVVIEGIVSLRRTHPGAYDTPDWGQFLPHVS